MEDPIAEAWLINHRATLLLIANLDEAGLNATLSKRGGRTVGEQFVHVSDVRLARLEAGDPRLLAGVTRLARSDGGNQAKLIHGLTTSANALAELIRNAAPSGEVKGFKRGIAALAGYLIAHEAHHRGHALLTLKQAGIRIPDELRFGLWAWEKI